jgi:tRNA dimethylallyltransferase
VGKTAVAIALAQQLGTAIVSADSRQCYREMNIGVARPSVEELAAVRHYFIAEYPVGESLTAADYETLALQYLDHIFETTNTAVVCGGTGLYIKALTDGLDEMPPTNPQITADIEQQLAEQGMPWLQQCISVEDPGFYAAGEVYNPHRMMRALAFVRSTGQSILKYRTGIRKVRDFEVVKVGLQLPREQLYERINHRVDHMMAAGLLDEVKALYPHQSLKNLQTVGYTELFDYIAGKCTLAHAVDKIKQHTRNYAKRQMTWFAKDKEVHWINANDTNIVAQILAL